MNKRLRIPRMQMGREIIAIYKKNLHLQPRWRSDTGENPLAEYDHRVGFWPAFHHAAFWNTAATNKSTKHVSVRRFALHQGRLVVAMLFVRKFSAIRAYCVRRRDAHTSAFVEGELVVMGGHDGSNYLASCEIVGTLSAWCIFSWFLMHSLVHIRARECKIECACVRACMPAHMYLHEHEHEHVCLLPVVFLHNEHIHAPQFSASSPGFGKHTKWTPIGAMTTTRGFHASAHIDRTVYAYGGQGSQTGPVVEYGASPTVCKF
jgi:hypothetical protein